MRRRLAVIAAAAAASVAGVVALPSANAAELCYDIQVDINGQAQGQAGCQELPALPALP